jgi:hypothetical protein
MPAGRSLAGLVKRVEQAAVVEVVVELEPAPETEKELS